MNRQREHERNTKRNQEGTIAIRRSPAGTAPEAAGSAAYRRLAERLYPLLLHGIERLTGKLLKQRRRRRKRQLLEMQQLGEKRFVVIVRVGKQQFLIGGAATSVSLLAEIDTHRAGSHRHGSY
jgi:Flagellar biosynthesis protein, FliO